MRQIYMARDRIDADLVCDEVRGRGFGVVVIGDVAAIPSVPYPSVWVDDSEYDAALAAWAEVRDSRKGGV